MKILQITPYFLPHKGGTERYVYNLSKSLVDKGHEVTVYTSNIPKNQPVENIRGISVFRFNSIVEPLRNPIVPHLLIPLKELQKFDLIHVHRLYSSMALSAILLKKVHGVPVVLTHHGRARYERPVEDFFVQFFEQLFFHRILSESDGCITLSESDAGFLASFVTANKISIIPNAINSAELLHNSRQEIDQFLKIHHLEDKKIVLYVGRLMALKGVQYLIEAFSFVQNKIQDPSVMLVIAGKGNEVDALKKMTWEYALQDSVLFINDVTDKDRNFLYQSSSLFVLPSLSEGFPTTVLEAMYYGIPVIGTDLPVLKQHFSNAAILVPQRDSRALAEAILALLSDPAAARELSRKGTENVMNNFTWSIIVKKYITLYSDIVAGNPAGYDP